MLSNDILKNFTCYKYEKGKGCHKLVVKRKIRHANYIGCLKNDTLYMYQMKAIRSSKHKICTIKEINQEIK